ncbi:MAG: hypothetical protein RLZZ292_2885 [Bacteroidota bacterium]|jgi:hypothetical protein
MDKKLELLSQIETVEAPPFLFTRITQQIENERIHQFSPHVSWALGFSMVLILSLNIAVLLSSNTPSAPTNLAQTMHLLPKNDFYK